MFASDPGRRGCRRTTTWSPRASSARHRCEPRKPAPPVTTTRAHSGRPMPVVGEAAPAHGRRVEEVAGSRRSAGPVSSAAHLVEVEPAELVPLGEHGHHLGARRRPRRGRADGRRPRAARRRRPAGGRPWGRRPGPRRPASTQPADHLERRRVAQVVGPRLEGQAPHARRSPRRASPSAAASAILSTIRSYCSSLTSITPFEQLEVVAGLLGDADQGPGVLGEARPPQPGPGPQELEADPLVVAHPEDDVADVGADRLAQVGDGVDEADLGGQEGVGGVLDRLGRWPGRSR